MQYLLTDHEYMDLLNRASRAGDLPSVQTLQEFCTRVADEMPIGVDWIDEIRPWGCIITVNAQGGEHYCDECPAEKVCPYPNKQWSK